MFRFVCLIALLFFGWRVSALTYEVGPGKSLSAISQVPWESLNAGDTVLIYYRTNPYTEKFVLCRQGTAAAPITVRGVAGPNGELPVLSGNGAVTRTNLNYWGETRGIIKIGGANKPADTMPQFITLENLEIRSARSPYTFTGYAGTVQSYNSLASSIWIEKGFCITIRNCTLDDSSVGFFVSSGDTTVSQNILMERCYVYGNGNTNDVYAHNIYTEALGLTYQFNHFGPPRAGCPGNNLKDRSAGLVVRYNWIEGGNRELDLVDAEDSAILRANPSYRSTHVYGNVIIEPFSDGNSQIVHYGGDSGTLTNYRHGTLYFYNNTVVSRRTSATVLFHLSTINEQCEARNNIFYITNNATPIGLLDADGELVLSHNWLTSGYKNSYSALTGSITNDGTNLTGTNGPSFLNVTNNDFHLMIGSPCIDNGGSLPVAATNFPASEYVMPQAGAPRATNGPIDIGALEYRSPLETWRAAQFGTNATNLLVAGDTADPDHDGVVNLAEYALGQNPLVFTSNGLPHAQIISNGTDVALSFPTLRTPSGVAYVVQTSSNLMTWVDGCVFSDITNVTSTAETMDISPAGSTNKTVRFKTPVTGNKGAFMRLKIESR